MTELVSHLFGVVGPVFLCAAVGFGLTRAGQPFEPKVTTPIIMNVAMPALIVAHLSEQHVSIAAFSTVMVAALIAVTLFGIAAMVLLRVCGLPFRPYLAAFMFSNVGNIGLPSVTLAFGAGGLAIAFGFWIVVMVGMLTVGTWPLQRTFSFKRLVSSPLIHAILIGLGLLASGARLPDILHAPLDILGGAAIPLMLLSLGNALAGLKPEGLVRGFVLALAHLAIVAPVAALTVAILDLQGLVRSVFILEALMPVSVLAYLFALQYDPDDAPALASLILFSTVLTVVVLPLALAYWI